MGHIRDLPSKSGSIDPDKDFEMHYQIKNGSQKNVDKILSAAKKKCDSILLATDPDREGEAIAWHIAAILKDKNIDPQKIKRITFNEITKEAIKNALKNEREIDQHLVDAQQARLALDYLVGFGISPILWRKLPGSKSAGRVQSVALRILTEREIEIKSFVPTEYWSIDVGLNTIQNHEKVVAQVVKYKNHKFTNEYPDTEEIAEQITKEITDGKHLIVHNIEHKEIKQNPTAPFTTATLQQEASKKLGFSSKKTMQIAQKLYEGVSINGSVNGLITYMRTDGMQMASTAISGIREFIKETMGDEYIPSSPKIYSTSVKNAQEAHEAIRPTNINITPSIAQQHLEKDFARLYELIWKRTIACQMKPAIKSVESIQLVSPNGNTAAKIVGSRIKFDGFLRVYNNSQNIEKSTQDHDHHEESIVPKMEIGENLPIHQVVPKQHFTSPPPRFTEASLIKTLEELGIGRPSTYATIISILQDRGYATIEKRAFHASNNGILVTGFLKHFFKQYIEYNFTAKLEDNLDAVSNGEMNRIALLRQFWQDFSPTVNHTSKLDNKIITHGLTQEVASYFFQKGQNDELDNKCPDCTTGELNLQSGKYGAYLGCSNYPTCQYHKSIHSAMAVTQDAPDQQNETSTNKNNENFILKTGPFGSYLQITDSQGEIRRIPIAKDIDQSPENLQMYSLLPMTIGQHPETKENIVVTIGRYGPYISCGKKHASITHKQIFEIKTEDAITMLSDVKTKTSKSTSVTLVDPESKKEIKIGKSRYGVYALINKKYHTIKGVDKVEDVTLESALRAIRE